MILEKNYNIELDFILEQLIIEYQNSYQGVNFYTDDKIYTTKEKMNDLVKEKYKLKDWEVNILFYKLFIDHYVKTVDPLIISIEGLVFRNNGGYVQKVISAEKETIRIQKVENDFKRYSFYLMLFTAIVALGTVISAWFFSIEIWKHYVH